MSEFLKVRHFRSLETASADDWARIDAPENAAAEAAWAADGLLGFLASMKDHPGFGMPVNTYVHCLQTATRAWRAQESDGLIVAALFHDLFDQVEPLDHAGAAARLLSPYLDADLVWLVEHHAIFQDAHFLHHPTRLSNDRARFATHPMYSRTVHFCADYDECSFDQAYDTLPLEHFEPIVRRVIALTAGC